MVTGQGYAGRRSGDHHLIDPVAITRLDRAGRVTDEIESRLTNPAEKASLKKDFQQKMWSAWRQHQFDDQDKHRWTRVYHDIPPQGEGQPPTHYDETRFAYDKLYRRQYVVTLGGTVTKTTFEVRGLPVTVELGAAAAGPPAGSEDVPAVLRKVASMQYDDGLSGRNGNLTQQIAHVDGDQSHDRTTTFRYNWRDQRIRMRRPDEQDDVEYKYNYLGQPIEESDKPRQYERVSLRDVRGRVYQVVHRYILDTGRGVWFERVWRDAGGNVLAAERNGGLALSRYQYDALNRVTAQFVSCLPSGSGYARISTYKEANELAETKKLTRDVVFEQSEFEYDAADNLISRTRRRRSPGASPQRDTQEPGVLQSEEVRPQARVDHVAFWHDALGRVASEADYGANGMAQFTRPAAFPSSTDDVLVLKHAYTYNEKRRLEVYQVDPYGRVLRTTHDHAGRRMEVLENWTWPGTQPTRYAAFKYTPDGQIETITASNVSDGSTADQVTEYVYGGKLDGVRLSILVESVVDPMGRISSFSYNRQQEQTKYTDPNDTIHSYTYDELGRLKLDSIQPGLRLAAHVVGLAYEYNERGLPKRIQSLDRDGKIVNEVYRLYNQFGLLRFEAQHHFDPEKEGYGKTIDYGYDVGGMAQINAGTDEEPAVYLVGHPPRLATIVYPRDDAVIHLGYFDRLRSDAVNRVAFVAEGEETSAEPDPIIGRQSKSKRSLAEYTRFGLGDMYRVSYPETEKTDLHDMPPLAFDANGGFPPSDPADDLEYDALDRFDRLIELNWMQRGYGLVERLAYWYDRVGSRLARRSRPYVPWSLGNPPVTRTHDERYEYDELYRLKDMQRGTLPGTLIRNPDGPLTLTDPTFAQSWELDQQDNWDRFTEDADGDGTDDLVQTREHERSNRIVAVMNHGSPNTRRRVEYDRAGNMTRFPRLPDFDKVVACEYDGWNRLVRVKHGKRTVGEYQYDALGRRIVKRVYDESTGDLTEVRHFYYSHDWRVLQERLAIAPEGQKPWESRLDRQYVWGVRGADDLILRDRDTKQTPNGVPNERQYALADDNGNIISLYDVQHEYSAVPAKRLVERIEYDAYGRPRFMDKDFGSLSESGKDWSVLYGGYYYDAETGLYHVRNRMYHPLYGRWLQTDPSGFGDSYNLYQYALSNPLTYRDPMGRFVIVGGILIGAAIGAAIGALSYGVEVAATDKEFTWSGLGTYVGIGALAGAAAGLTGGLAAGAGWSLWATGTAGGAAGGLVHGGVHGGIAGGWQGAIEGGTIGSISGAVGGAVGGAFLRSAGASLGRFVLSGSAGGAAGGFVAGGGSAALRGENIIQGALRGAAVGGSVGAIGGAGGFYGARITCAMPQVLRNVRIRAIANRLGIRTDRLQVSLRDHETVEFFKRRMRRSKSPGDWDVDTGDITYSKAGDSKVLSEGNHRMRAALEMMLEAGDDRFVQEAIAKAYQVEPGLFQARPFVNLPLRFPDVIPNNLAIPLLAPIWIGRSYK